MIVTEDLKLELIIAVTEESDAGFTYDDDTLRETIAAILRVPNGTEIDGYPEDVPHAQMTSAEIVALTHEFHFGNC